ncbi:MAG: Bax inhibitor-1/YccA family protein [Holosporales bacterium]|jgi:FtsH-binding integral membrane protein|nr:Bax inhibitor-1/YccA family protein [Holosporales bacterium]
MVMRSNEETVLRRGAAPNGDRFLSYYMQKIYGIMTIGLGISAFIAYVVSSSPAFMQYLFGTKMVWLVALMPLFLVIALSASLNKVSSTAAVALFVAFSACMGVSLSSVFCIYTAQSITSTFLVVMALFGGMCLYGYTTKKDLTSMGSFLVMGLWGLIIAMFINMFMKNSMLEYALSAIAVVIFTGLTAYDVQVARLSCVASDDNQTVTKKAVVGALRLYLDFINLFLHLLRFMGNRK